MTAQPVLDIFEETPEAIIPACGWCSARGERIEVDGLAIPDFNAAAIWGWLEIRAHEREMHPEKVFPHRLLCSGCGSLLGQVKSQKHDDELRAATAVHVAGCQGGSEYRIDASMQDRDGAL